MMLLLFLICLSEACATTRKGPSAGEQRAERPRRDLRIGIQPGTATRYAERVRQLDQWFLHTYHIGLARAAEFGADALAVMAAPYLQGLYDSGRPLSWGTDTLAGLQTYYPLLRGRIKSL